MSGTGRDWGKLIIEAATVAVIVAPFMPEARVRWWCAMRLAQGAATRLGMLAIAAENRYRAENV